MTNSLNPIDHGPIVGGIPLMWQMLLRSFSKTPSYVRHYYLMRCHSHFGQVLTLTPATRYLLANRVPHGIWYPFLFLLLKGIWGTYLLDAYTIVMSLWRQKYP